jgi:hypothetical protein
MSQLTERNKEYLRTLIEHCRIDMSRENGTYRKLHKNSLDEIAIRRSKKAIELIEQMIF